MANILKKVRRGIEKKRVLRKRQKMEKQIQAPARGLTEDRKRFFRHRSAIILGTAAILVVAAGVGSYLFVRNIGYANYKVVNTSDLEDTISSSYMEISGKLFKYSGDGASVEDSAGNIAWNVAYEMQNPIADKCDGVIAVADQGGTTICVFDKNGELGTISTSLNIVKIKVAKQGVVAAILDGGEDTWVNFYAVDGSLIAENQTRIDDPGYPLDLAVSEDGELVMVTYQFVSGEETTSYVVFYNFASTGQNQIDNIVSGYQYQGVVIPQVEYLDESSYVAFRDDGFSVYEGKQIPKEVVNVVVEKEIISTFYDEEHIGLVFKNDSQSEKQYTMQVYNTSGEVEFTKNFNISYTSIGMSGGFITMHNDTQVCVITDKGVLRYNGNIDEGTINDFFKIGINKYLLVMDNGLATIKFK